MDRLWTLVAVFSIIAYSNGLPVNEESTPAFEPSTEDQHLISLQRDINLVAYIQNFKQVMAQYVNAQYQNLTIDEMEKVKMTLEEFLQNFATDLRETIENKNNDDISEVNDGTNEETFGEIKKKLVIEFPEVTDSVADKIIVKLKKNLYATRSKLDNIIRESYKASVENSHS